MEPFRPSEEVLAVLAELATQEWRGEVWRHTFADYPADKTNLRGARWNPAGVEALYASLSRRTAIAEAQHQLDVQPMRPTAARRMHKLNVSVYRLLDLTESVLLERLGATADDLAGDEFRTCQAIGGTAAYLEVDGLLVPSARDSGSNLVILFVDTAPSPIIEVVSSEVLEGL